MPKNRTNQFFSLNTIDITITIEAWVLHHEMFYSRWEITLSTITALIAAKRDALRMNLPDRRGREVI